MTTLTSTTEVILTDKAFNGWNLTHQLLTYIDKDMTPRMHPSILMMFINLIRPVFLLIHCNMAALYYEVRTPV